MVVLDNTFVIRTDDEQFRQALDRFLMEHCDKNGVNAVALDLSKQGAEKVMDVIFEEM